MTDNMIVSTPIIEKIIIERSNFLQTTPNPITIKVWHRYKE